MNNLRNKIRCGISLSILTVPAAVALLAGSAHGNINIGFEGATLTESGFTTTTTSGTAAFFSDTLNIFSGNEGGASNIPDSGSVALLVNGGSPASIGLSFEFDQPFSLISFRASEGRNVNSSFFPRFGASGLLVTGTQVGGGVISDSVLFDRIANESPDDFQSFSLSGFTDLSNVSFTAIGGDSGYAFGIDDISVNVVPEPSSAALITGLAIAGLAARRRILK